MRAEAQFRRDQVHHDSAVEGVARNGYARSADDGSSTSPFSTGAKVRQREVTCSTPKVSYQNQLIVIQLGFILVCGGDWFQLECGLRKSRRGQLLF